MLIVCYSAKVVCYQDAAIFCPAFNDKKRVMPIPIFFCDIQSQIVIEFVMLFLYCVSMVSLVFLFLLFVTNTSLFSPLSSSLHRTELHIYKTKCQKKETKQKKNYLISLKPHCLPLPRLRSFSPLIGCCRIRRNDDWSTCILRHKSNIKADWLNDTRQIK